MPKQLTIFDVESVVAFDTEKAHIHRLNSKVRFTDIVVQVPKQVRATDELKPMISMNYLRNIQLGFGDLNEWKINSSSGKKRRSFASLREIIKNRFRYDFIYY